MADKIVLVTGGFDPLHSGHIKYFDAAKELGDKLIVGLNSDDWLMRKKGVPFMNIEERIAVVSALRVVDEVITFADSDGSSMNAILDCLKKYPKSKIVFANGGDRGSSNVPETALTNERIIFEFGVGGNEKQNSSSWILQNFLDNSLQD